MISDKILAKIFVVGIIIAFSTCIAGIFHLFPEFVYMWEVAGGGWLLAFVAITLRVIKNWGRDDEDL